MSIRFFSLKLLPYVAPSTPPPTDEPQARRSVWVFPPQGTVLNVTNVVLVPRRRKPKKKKKGAKTVKQKTNFTYLVKTKTMTPHLNTTMNSDEFSSGPPEWEVSKFKVDGVVVVVILRTQNSQKIFPGRRGESWWWLCPSLLFCGGGGRRRHRRQRAYRR